MKPKNLIVYSPIIVCLFGLSILANAATPAPVNKEEKILEKVSKEGWLALRELKWARVSIFDGDVNRAKSLLEESKKYLTEVEKQAPQLIVTVKTEEKVGDKTVNSEKSSISNDLIPVDAGLVLSEDFIATPEKSEKIKKANEHLKNKETSKAIEVLREADIGVSVSRELMPVKETVKHVDQAIEQLNNHQYYESNLSLKAVQDSLIVDTVLLYEPVNTPKK